MRVLWEVDDGYAGKSRPQTTIIDDNDLEACETDEERELLINQEIQFDFEQKISWYEVRREE